jgi:hypothetical protein
LPVPPFNHFTRVLTLPSTRASSRPLLVSLYLIHVHHNVNSRLCKLPLKTRKCFLHYLAVLFCHASTRIVRRNSSTGNVYSELSVTRVSDELGTNVYRRHEKKHSKGPLSCEHCDKTFKYPKDQKRHALTHTGERPYKCRACGKSYTRAEHVTRHKCKKVLQNIEDRS